MGFLASVTPNPATDIATVIDVLKAIIGLFSLYPLNIAVAAMVGGYALTLFGKGKKTVKPQ